MGKKNSKLKQDTIDRLTTATYFTEKEIRQWHKGFLKDCPNGLLTEQVCRQNCYCSCCHRRRPVPEGSKLDRKVMLWVAVLHLKSGTPSSCLIQSCHQLRTSSVPTQQEHCEEKLSLSHRQCCRKVNRYSAAGTFLLDAAIAFNWKSHSASESCSCASTRL
ncbi:uncharacterized protein LOC134207130 isoform X2 [Armigeres subalbatus]|uniref:uncharacterized protein LOC134207130 isoform X2 n=1 Tax=Armigeres subalbatus TaxID=124917 RepID=UPI002ED0AFEE